MLISFSCLLYFYAFSSFQAQVQPQTELFCYVIKQLNSRDLAFSLVGIARNVICEIRQKFFFLLNFVYDYNSRLNHELQQLKNH